MNKIMAKIVVISNDIPMEEEIECLFDKEKQVIQYVENGNTKVILDIFNNRLIRENNEIYMNYLFDMDKTTDNEVLIKELNKIININIKTEKIINDLLMYNVIYTILDGDRIEYKIEFLNK